MDVLEQLVSAVERNAVATEKMLAIAEQEQIIMQEPGPPVCPHCGKLDPVVTELPGEAGGSGKLSDFVVRCETHCCNRVVFAIPNGWDTAVSQELAEDILKIKKGGNPGE